MPTRIVLFPVENLSGVRAPVEEIGRAVETALRAHGLDVVSGDRLAGFLAAHRIRFTGGVDAAASQAARDELEADAVLIPSLEAYSAGYPPRLSITARLISTGEAPSVVWMGGVARAGDEHPGILGLGLVRNVGRLQDEAMSALAGDIAAFLARGGGPVAPTCPEEGRFRPRVAYRSALLSGQPSPVVVVLPFTNPSGRPKAGEVVALHLMRQLLAEGRATVLDPGMARDSLLAHRIIMEGGVSLDDAHVVLDAIQADIAVTGSVRGFEDRTGPTGTPRVEFSVVALEKETRQVVWSSVSYASGDKGVFAFNLGSVATASALACRMARSVVTEMNVPRPTRRVGEHRANSASAVKPGARSASATPIDSR